MHKSSMLRMKACVDNYIIDGEQKKILDIGSYDVNGCYKNLFDNYKLKYEGMDIEDGPNVNIVVKDTYNWKEIEDDSYDYIISGQALEHM